MQCAKTDEIQGEVVKFRNKAGTVLASIVLFSLSFVPEIAALARKGQEKTGAIKGKIIDEELKSPIPYATVKIKGTAQEAKSGEQGEFEILDVLVGSYVLEISGQFYAPIAKPDVIVKSQRITYVEVELKLDIDLQEHEEVEVTADYYASSQQQTQSLTSFTNEEIRRAAGSGGDVSRIVSGLPSIARVNDQVNSLIVRGGSPVENAFLIDNMAIPNINHYPIQGSSGGALALLNVDFIQDVRFYSGGFSPQYGNRLSSVMDVSFREGNRNELDLQLDFSMAGIGALAEGPLLDGNASWMVSARRSYIDLLSSFFNVGVAPKYGDLQGKVSFDLSSRSKLSLLGVWGNDKSGWGREESFDLGDSTYGYHNANNNVVGANCFYNWGTRAYSQTSLSRSYIKYDIDFFDTQSGDTLVSNKSWEESYTLRNINFFKLGDRHNLNFGAEVSYLGTHNDYFLGAYIDKVGNPVPDVHIDRLESAGRYGAFVNYGFEPFNKLTLNLGGRLDYLSFNQNMNLSPRFSLAYRLTKRTSLNAAAGIFYQNLPSLLLFQNETHRDLKDPRAYHYVLGLSHLLTESTRLTIEFYNKEYERMPLDPAQPWLNILDELFYNGYYTYHEQLLDQGKGRSYGVEFLVQKKLATKLYGLISASYFRTEYQDLSGIWRNRVYDNRFIVAVEGGYKPSSSWEFSLKWNYAGGVPYTPFDLEDSSEVNSGIYDENRINAERLPAYHSLNLRADKRFYFGGSNLTIFFSMWNVYNRENIAFIFWNTLENKPDYEYQWGFLPILGVEFEF